MEIGSSSIHLIAVFIAYFLFVFISERLNPFAKPKSYAGSISRWRFARIVATAFLLFTWLGLFAAGLLQISKIISLSISTLLFAIFWAIKGAKRRVKRNKFHAMSEETRFKIESSDGSSNLPTAPKAVPNAEVQPNNQSPSLPTEHRPAKVDFIDSKETDKHELEMELAIAHIPPDLTDLDQSIVEAEFESVFGDAASGQEVSSPDFSTAQSRITTKNNLNVQLLNEEYQRLSASRDSLINEVASLKVSLKNSQAAERKSEAIRDHALLLKDKALEIAAMERKKRRITEVKASKVIMKLRRNKELLEASDDRQAFPNRGNVSNKPKVAS